MRQNMNESKGLCVRIRAEDKTSPAFRIIHCCDADLALMEIQNFWRTMRTESHETDPDIVLTDLIGWYTKGQTYSNYAVIDCARIPVTEGGLWELDVFTERLTRVNAPGEDCRMDGWIFRP